MSDVEIACVNSPDSVVLASSEARLKEVEALLPENVSKTFVPGNIAFHSSRTEPCLKPIRKRLAFLKKQPHTWALPFISSVTGKVESSVGPDYWCDNVREPVLFQKAIETAFAGDSVPEVVIEIGPHKTLCSPILQVREAHAVASNTWLGIESGLGIVYSRGVDRKRKRPSPPPYLPLVHCTSNLLLSSLHQTLSAMGKSAAVLPTLKKNDDCVLRFLEALGTIFEKGLNVDAKPWFHDLSFTMHDPLPRHPYIYKRMHELHPVLKRDMRNGLYSEGPLAGVQKFFDGAFVVEVSDRTYKKMTDHKMGGAAIFPGMFFVEMVLEALKGTPVTLTNVEFKSMLKIPASSTGEPPALVALSFAEQQDDVRTFLVRSCPSRERWDEDPVLVSTFFYLIDRRCLGV